MNIFVERMERPDSGVKRPPTHTTLSTPILHARRDMMVLGDGKHNHPFFPVETASANSSGTPAAVCQLPTILFN
jgi:hypothetical protein